MALARGVVEGFNEDLADTLLTDRERLSISVCVCVCVYVCTFGVRASACSADRR